MKRYTLMVLSLFIIMSMVLAACQQPAVAPTEEPPVVVEPTEEPVVVEPTEEPKELGTENDFRIKNFSNYANAEITFEPGDKCTLKVNKDAQHDPVTLKILVNDDTYDNYLIAVYTLQEGYTIEDLLDYPTLCGPPCSPGANMLSYYVFDPGSATIIRYFGYDEGELYFTCQVQGPDNAGKPWHPIDTLGPLVVKGEIDATAVPPSGVWNPILATTRAKPAPPAASCPPGTNPNAPGPADQDRPEAGWTSILAAVFDRHTGSIVYVDTLGETWTLDVCTNTWHRMNPTGAMLGDLSAGLVYDVDSDLTVALGYEHISVYDANTNTWTQPSNNTIGNGDGRIIPMGAVYDPISGLILTTDLTDSYLDIWAYDVDTNTWTLIGRLWEEQEEDDTWFGFELLGYSQETDRLIFTSIDNTTALVDPRTGYQTLISTPTPAISFGWPKAQYGPAAADTVYVAEGVWAPAYAYFNTRFPDQICGFDPGTSAWTSCFAIPGGSRYAAFAAMVGDPINNRLVLINGVYGGFWVYANSNVWAIDLDTGELTELLTPSDE